MGRRPGFTDEQVFSWLSERLAESPTVTVQEVSKGTGVSVGSLYHRYNSMEGLLAEAWLWAYGAFSSVVIEKLGFEGLRGAVHASASVLDFAAQNRVQATLVFAVPERYLVRCSLSGEIAERVEKARSDMEQALASFAANSGLDRETVELGVLSVPIAVASKYLPHSEIPESASVYAKKACRMILQAPINASSVEQV